MIAVGVSASTGFCPFVLNHRTSSVRLLNWQKAMATISIRAQIEASNSITANQYTFSDPKITGVMQPSSL